MVFTIFGVEGIGTKNKFEGQPTVPAWLVGSMLRVLTTGLYFDGLHKSDDISNDDDNQ